MTSPNGRRGPLDYSARVRRRPPVRDLTPVPATAPEEGGGRSRALTKYIPAPVQKRIGRATRRSAYIIMEIFGASSSSAPWCWALVYYG